MLRYLYNNTLVEEDSLPADLTLLDYLRENRQQCGTKEGCASGDCGACTVVIAEVALDADGHDSLTYRTANSCITFAGALHGKQLITVENLETKPESRNKTTAESGLHLSQRKMVEHHASQCGFCTPGFVMSLFAATKNTPDKPVSRSYVDEQLGGNLCRCTGYRPIIDAALEALNESPEQDQFDCNADQTIASLKAIASSHPAGEQNSRSFFRPSSIDELCKLRLEHPQAVILAGGTDLALRVTQQLETLNKVIMVGGVPELSFFTVTDNDVRIGASTTLTDFRKHIVRLSPELEPLLVRFGGTQVRNQATVGGNFANASPVGDLPPVFIALNASVVLVSARGERTVSASDYFLSYKKTMLAEDEIIREFIIPRAAFFVADGATRIENRFYKISKRLDDDISAVCMAIHLQMHGDKIVQASTGFGGMAATPKRAAALEAVLVGRVLDEQCQQDAGRALQEDFQPIDDVRASAAYRHRVSANLLVRLATELYTPEVPATVTVHEY